LHGITLSDTHTHTHTHIHTHTTLGRIPLDEGSARCGDLYFTTHNTHKKQNSMPPVGFEPTVPASERSQTQVDCTASGIGDTVTGPSYFSTVISLGYAVV
jgi:hypothetical protein